MKKKPLSILAIMVILLTASCSRGVRMSRELAAIDSLMDIKPDSALALLGRMDSMPMRQSDRMYLELLRGKAMNKAYVKFTSDSAMLEVARYFDRHGDTNQRMLAHYVLGCAYRDMGNAPRALECYQDAADIADTTSADCDHSTLMRVHGQMNELFMRLRMEKDALRESEIAQRLCWQMGDTLSALIFEEAICNHLYNTKQYEACIQKALHLHQQYTEHGFLDEADAVYVFCVKSYLELQDYEKAKLYLDRFAKCRYFLTDPRKIKGGKGILYIYKAQYHLRVQNADSAAHYFQMALPYAHLNNNALLAYHGLFESYSMLHQADSALKYINLYSEQKERTYHKGNAETALQMENLYNYSSEQKMAERAQKRSALLRMVILWLSSLALLVIVILLYRHRQKQKELERLKKKIATSTIRLKDSECQLQELIAQHNEKEQEIEQAKERINALLTEQASVRQEADNIQSEKERIVSMLTDVQGQVDRLLKERKDIQSAISSQEREIEGVRWQANYLQEELRKRDDKDYSNLIQQKEEIVSVFQDALLDFKHKTITDNDWGKLRHVLESMYPTFHSTLYARENLSETEYQICLLVKAGFNTYEINTIMGKSSSYASVLRGRLLAKVFGVEGSPHQFDERIRLIGNPTIPTP